MNNEPVAWILADKENEYIRSVMIVKHDIVPKDCIEIPLYTHPASLVDWSYQQGYKVGKETHLAKTLTDDEIMALAVENGAWKSKESGNVYPDDLELLDFARAILRKAQEK